MSKEVALPRKLPDWASDGEPYRLQVRELTKYAMFLLDTDGILLSWNEGVERILGYQEHEWVGQHASIIFTPADKALEVCESEMKIAAEAGTSADIRWHVRKDGSELFGNGCMTAVRAEDGTLVGYSKIFSDETKSKELQDTLTESNAALEQFAYVASHDLQEPLRTITSFAELLNRRHGSQLDAEARNFLDLIIGGAKRMSSLVVDLLAYARVRTELDRPSSYSMDQDVETALSSLKSLIEESNATVTHDPLPEIQADQGQMVRLFQNLVGNGVKYRKPDVAPVIHVSSKRQDSHWVISVQDNGIGFDPKYAKEIFTPFKRLHTQTQYPGTGVGLAICRRIVENHGGRIWAESAVSQEQPFTSRCPLLEKHPIYTRAPLLRDCK